MLKKKEEEGKGKGKETSQSSTFISYITTLFRGVCETGNVSPSLFLQSIFKTSQLQRPNNLFFKDEIQEIGTLEQAEPKTSSLSIFVNDVLLGQGLLISLHIVCGFFCAVMVELSHKRDHMDTKTKYIYLLPFIEKVFPTPILHIWVQGVANGFTTN